MIDKVKTIIKLETDEPDIYIKYFAKDESIREETFDWGELEEYINNLEDRIDKAINELFELKDMVYKPETREINFDIQKKITSIIKCLGSDKE